MYILLINHLMVYYVYSFVTSLLIQILLYFHVIYPQKTPLVVETLRHSMRICLHRFIVSVIVIICLLLPILMLELLKT